MYKNINIIILFFALIFSYIGGFCNNNEIISKKDTAHIYEFEIVDSLLCNLLDSVIAYEKPVHGFNSKRISHYFISVKTEKSRSITSFGFFIYSSIWGFLPLYNKNDLLLGIFNYKERYFLFELSSSKDMERFLKQTSRSGELYVFKEYGRTTVIEGKIDSEAINIGNKRNKIFASSDFLISAVIIKNNISIESMSCWANKKAEPYPWFEPSLSSGRFKFFIYRVFRPKCWTIRRT